VLKGGERSLVLPGVLLAERRELLSVRGVKRLNMWNTYSFSRSDFIFGSSRVRTIVLVCSRSALPLGKPRGAELLG
jgi:hypothetical protein